MSFSQAVSGLNAAASNLDVIGNNIANSATSGFKSSTAAFADMFAGSQTGLGTKVSAVIQNFGDGSINATGRNLDVALSGNGFFRLEDSNGSIYYSRNGQLQRNADGYLVNTEGLQVTGYPVSGSPATVQTGADPVPLIIPTTQLPARATTQGSLQVNLNSSDALPSVTPFDAKDANSYNAKSSMTVYDSQGNDHQLNLYFVKTANNQWQVYPIDGSTGDTSADFTMSFDENGQLTSDAMQPITLQGANGAAANQGLTLDFTGSSQQNTGETQFGNPKQDGYAPGDLTGFTINDDGTIVGSYSNQRTQPMGQIVLGSFTNSEGLQPKGDNLWSESTSSGQPAIGTPGSGNFGTMTAGALEASNVDLSKELVNMIVAQRNYQSNAQTIKTQDQILNTLVNLR
ncbi:flagellar hook protein FlgE [Tatumella sp. TA1]|uniref:flagellar hook protein FlgE n=1 Tax=Rosenbergiella collisarenosi TaxID=1544695 RepID=UPI0008F8BC59|nr:flagellar hook protein FlgE [Rosenbergiella collisarenosi]MBT0721143.1 flagellar hook protein FlgE [Rosenbergiella collisarenosi]QGX91179.1 flagellar hook protein FlgE [Tatumella sp. TA1]